MEDQESYLNEEEVNQGLNKVGNAATQFGQGMYGGIKSGIKDFKDIKNHGLQSSNKDLDDTKKEPEIPEPKNQNPNSTGAPNQLPGSDNSNNPLDKNKDEEGTKKDDDKKEKSKKDDGKKDKKQSLKEKINEKNPLNKLKKKIDEKNPLKKLNKKLEEKLNLAKLLLKKVKLYGGLILLGCSLILILIIALVGGTAIHTTLHNITEDFVCSASEITESTTTKATNTFGWHLKKTGEYEGEGEGKKEIYEAVFNDGIDVELEDKSIVNAIQPGTITTVNNDYIEINHNLNNENDYNNKTYITRYYNYGKLHADTEKNSLVVKESILFYANDNILHFVIIDGDKTLDPNILFGYEKATPVCGDKDLIKTTRGTLENEDIKLLYDNKCFDNAEYLGKMAKEMACNGYNSGIFSDELVNYDGFKARENAPTRTNSFYYEQNSNNYGLYLEGECAMYATCRAQEILSTMGINKSFTTNVNGGKFCSAVSGYQIGMTPRQGSLVSWSGGKDNKYGHVAVVEKVNADGSIVISEMYAKLGYYGSNAWDIIDASPNPKETRKYNCSANGSGCWQMRTIPANRINDAGWGNYRLNCFIYLLGD